MPKPEGADTGRAGKHLVCAALELRGWEVALGDGPAGQITARQRASGVEVDIRVNTIWHDTATVWPLADRHRFEETPDPHAIHVLVRLNGLNRPADFYVIPRAQLVAEVTAHYDAWIREPKASGEPRTSKLVTTLGFDESAYRDRWDILIG